MSLFTTTSVRKNAQKTRIWVTELRISKVTDKNDNKRVIDSIFIIGGEGELSRDIARFKVAVQ